MPIPMDLQHATEDFERFLADARDTASLGTRNQVYTMVDGVLRVFRRRLSLDDAIRFAGVLPPVLRAIFVADWDPAEPRRTFTDRAALTAEVQDLRRHHNFAPASAIADVAAALRRNMEAEKLDRVLAILPEGAAGFWAV
ncbi:DUF2267 domain-containing protein [Xanthobacter versatilis]|uniref:DUF2267 domain-containing protein n=1 Tax=Xanthobacter autotrophicus (strain ATCC BAA-1158 / Py2) TaxID=78245 RepID=UPI00372B45A2